MEDLQKSPVVITAACVLHNFLLREEGHQMKDCEEDGNDGNDCQAVDLENTTGQRKRDKLASLLVLDDFISVYPRCLFKLSNFGSTKFSKEEWKNYFVTRVTTWNMIAFIS